MREAFRNDNLDGRTDNELQHLLDSQVSLADIFANEQASRQSSQGSFLTQDSLVYESFNLDQLGQPDQVEANQDLARDTDQGASRPNTCKVKDPRCRQLLEQLLEREQQSRSPNNEKIRLLQLILAEQDNQVRISNMRLLLEGKRNNDSTAFLVSPERNAQAKEALLEVIRREERFENLKTPLVSMLPYVTEHLLRGAQDKERQRIYRELAEQEDLASQRKLEQLLKSENDRETHQSIADLLADKQDPNRDQKLRLLLEKYASTPDKKEIVQQILKHEERADLFIGILIAPPSQRSIATINNLLLEDSQKAQISQILQREQQKLNELFAQFINNEKNAEKQQTLRTIQQLPTLAEQRRQLEQLCERENNSQAKGPLLALQSALRTVEILQNLPAAEEQRLRLLQVIAKARLGEFEGIMAMYPEAVRWLKQVVPSTVAEVAAHKGMDHLLLGCPISLPLRHQRPMDPDLFAQLARQGHIQLTLNEDPSRLLDTEADIARFRNARNWYFNTKQELLLHDNRLDATLLVETLNAHFKKTKQDQKGQQTIPENWLPPENPELIPAWHARVMHVMNLSNQVRNYAQAFVTLGGVDKPESKKALEDLRKLGVEFRVWRGEIVHFAIPSLEKLDLRNKIPGNSRDLEQLAGWLAANRAAAEAVTRVHREAAIRAFQEKDPKALLRFGDFARTERLHPNIGCDYQLVSQRLKVTEQGEMVKVEGAIRYQTTSFYSYNYWLGCNSVFLSPTLAEFKQLNGNAEPTAGRQYKVRGSDGKVYDGWTYVGRNEDGTLKLERDEKFAKEFSRTAYIPVLNAREQLEIVRGSDLANWVAWQEYLWHHTVKAGKTVMDVGMLVAGGSGVFLRGASGLARLWNLGRFAVGAAGLSHHIVDTLDPVTRQRIHNLSYGFIMLDVFGSLGRHILFSKAMGSGQAGAEAASFLKTTNKIAHGAALAGSIFPYGPVLVRDVQDVWHEKNRTRPQDNLELALEAMGISPDLLKKPDEQATEQKPEAGAQGDLPFNFKDEKVRTATVKLLTRLADNICLESTNEQEKAEVTRILSTAGLLVALERTDQTRQDFQNSLVAKYYGEQPTGNARERVAAGIALLMLRVDARGKYPQDNLSVQIIDLFRQQAASSDAMSMRMACAKTLWRLGKFAGEGNASLDNHGLAGLLIDVALRSSDRQLRAQALADSDDISLGVLINEIMAEEGRAKEAGPLALEAYSHNNYGLTSADFKRQLALLVSLDGSNGKAHANDDIRVLAAQLLSAIDNDKAENRYLALVACGQDWHKAGAIPGNYAQVIIGRLRDLLELPVPDQPSRLDDNRLVSPDELREEKFKAAQALAKLGTVKIGDQSGNQIYKISDQDYNSALLMCLTPTRPQLSEAVVNNLRMSTLTPEQRRDVYAILAWPITVENEPAKIAVLQRLQLLLNAQNTDGLRNEAKVLLLAMLSGPESRQWVGKFPELHVAAITALAKLGCQSLNIAQRNFSRSELAALPGADQRLKTQPNWKPDPYEVFQITGENWYFICQNPDGTFLLQRPGDPTVVTLNTHLESKDRDGSFAVRSPHVRLAVLQAMDDLKVPGLRELARKHLQHETDPRVARVAAEICFSEQLPREPNTDESRRLMERFTAAILDNKYPALEEARDWLKGHDKYKVLFESDQDRFKRNLPEICSLDGWPGKIVIGYFIGTRSLADKADGGNRIAKLTEYLIEKGDKQYMAAFAELVKDARSGGNEPEDRKRRELATMALVWIIKKNCEDMPKAWRDYLHTNSVLALEELAKPDSKERGGVVRWAIESLLVLDTHLDPGNREILLAAACRLTQDGQELVSTPNSANHPNLERLAELLYTTIINEVKHTPWPNKTSNPEQYQKRCELHKAMIVLMTTYCRHRQSCELLEAIAETHRDPEVKALAKQSVRFLRDGIMRNLSDTRERPDRTSGSDVRVRSITESLRNPDTDAVIYAIAKACIGYQAGRDRDADEQLFQALRKAREDGRVRVQLVACYFLRYGQPKDFFDAIDRLYNISQGRSLPLQEDPSHVYYRDEAQQILNERMHESYPVQEALRRARDKVEGIIVAFREAQPDATLTREQQAQRIAQALANDNRQYNEHAALVAMFSAVKSLDTSGLNIDCVADPVLAQYRLAMQHSSARVRLGAAFALEHSSKDERDKLNAFYAMQEIARTGTPAGTKQQAEQLLVVLSNSYLARGQLYLALHSTMRFTNKSHNEMAEQLRQTLQSQDNLTATCQRIFQVSRSLDRISPQDLNNPCLQQLRNALNHTHPAVKGSAALALIENSSVPGDFQAAVSVLAKLAVPPSDYYFRSEAASILSRIKQECTSGTRPAEHRSSIELAERQAMITGDGVLQIRQLVEPYHQDVSLARQRRHLAGSLDLASDSPTDAQMVYQACDAIFKNARNSNDQETVQMLSRAIFHSNERVRLAASCALADIFLKTANSDAFASSVIGLARLSQDPQTRTTHQVEARVFLDNLRNKLSAANAENLVGLIDATIAKEKQRVFRGILEQADQGLFGDSIDKRAETYVKLCHFVQELQDTNPALLAGIVERIPNTPANSANFRITLPNNKVLEFREQGNNKFVILSKNGLVRNVLLPSGQIRAFGWEGTPPNARLISYTSESGTVYTLDKVNSTATKNIWKYGDNQTSASSGDTVTAEGTYIYRNGSNTDWTIEYSLSPDGVKLHKSRDNTTRAYIDGQLRSLQRRNASTGQLENYPVECDGNTLVKIHMPDRTTFVRQRNASNGTYTTTWCRLGSDNPAETWQNAALEGNASMPSAGLGLEFTVTRRRISYTVRPGIGYECQRNLDTGAFVESLDGQPFHIRYGTDNEYKDRWFTWEGSKCIQMTAVRHNGVRQVLTAVRDRQGQLTGQVTLLNGDREQGPFTAEFSATADGDYTYETTDGYYYYERQRLNDKSVSVYKGPEDAALRYGR